MDQRSHRLGAVQQRCAGTKLGQRAARPIVPVDHQFSRRGFTKEHPHQVLVLLGQRLEQRIQRVLGLVPSHIFPPWPSTYAGDGSTDSIRRRIAPGASEARARGRNVSPLARAMTCVRPASSSCKVRHSAFNTLVNQRDFRCRLVDRYGTAGHAACHRPRHQLEP